MSRRTDERFVELVKWWRFHRSTLPPEDLRKRCDFLETMCTNLLELFAMTTEDIEGLEGARRKLYLPRSVEVRGDVTRFG